MNIKKNSLNHIKTVAYILFGNFCIAAGTVFFMIPAGFISGGLTGIALMLHQYLHIPLPVSLAVLGIGLLVFAFFALGIRFAASSAISAFSYPVFIWICEFIERQCNFHTDSIALNLGAASLIIGYGVALVMRQGASTGGLDTIAMVLHKKKGVSLAVGVTVLEILSMSTQVEYSTAEGIVGGILLVVIYTVVMDYFIANETARIQVMIYSDNYEQINEFIDKGLRRGSTLFRVQGSYKREDTFALQTIISNRELFILKENVMEVDPSAFMIISKVSQVSGKGFTLESDVPGDSRTISRN